MARIMTGIVILADVAPPAPAANWTQVRDGKIARIRAAVDPRLILAGADA
jgi:hypothetical protein